MLLTSTCAMTHAGPNLEERDGHGISSRTFLGTIAVDSLRWYDERLIVLFAKPSGALIF